MNHKMSSVLVMLIIVTGIGFWTSGKLQRAWTVFSSGAPSSDSSGKEMNPNAKQIINETGGGGGGNKFQ